MSNTSIGKMLGVTVRVVNNWRRTWHVGGTEALMSKGRTGPKGCVDPDQRLRQHRLPVPGRQGPWLHYRCLDLEPGAAGDRRDLRCGLRRPLRDVVAADGDGVVGTSPGPTRRRAQRGGRRRLGRADLAADRKKGAETGAWFLLEDETGAGLTGA